MKNLATDFKNIPVFIYGYQDKFKALPGDDSAAVTHVTASANGNGNGLIDGLWLPAAVGDETALFWEDIRRANLAAGELVPAVGAGNTFQPKNAVGGYIGVTSAANSPILTLKGSYIICSDSIPGKFAKQLDTTLDDGVSNTGSVQIITQGTTAAGGTAKTPVEMNAAGADDTPYLVCMGF